MNSKRYRKDFQGTQCENYYINSKVDVYAIDGDWDTNPDILCEYCYKKNLKLEMKGGIQNGNTT